MESLTLILLTLIIALCFWYLYDSLSCKEDYVTSKDTTKKIAVFLNQNFKKGNLYDLGSSRGGVALDFSNQCPQFEITGIDNSILRILISRLRALISRSSVVFVNKDIFKMDISKADIVYVYIPRILLPELAVKLEKELHPGVTIITSRIAFLDWQPVKVIPKNSANEEDIFIYQFPFKQLGM